MYTTLEEAKEEIWRRWNDAELRRRVLEYAGEVPECMGQEPYAVLARHLATPNFEAIRFCKLTQSIRIKSVCFEYRDDVFCTNNIDKVLSAKMRFLHGKGRNNGNITTVQKLFSLPDNDNKPLTQIETLNGHPFMSLHHKILHSDGSRLEILPVSALYEHWGKKPSLYYRKFLSLFICKGILFENFLDDGDEGIFTREIVLPAIQKVTEHFGLKPLIVRLLPEETEADPYWCWYPGHLEAEVKKLINGSSVGQVPEQGGREACLSGVCSVGC